MDTTQEINDQPPWEAVDEQITATSVVEYSNVEAGLADLRTRYGGAVFDCTTTAGDKAARAARRELVSLRTTLDSIRLEHKRPLLAKIALLDNESKRIKGEIVALENPIDAQIKAEEERKAAEKAERERREQEALARRRALISRVSMMPARVAGKGASEIAMAINELTLISSDDSQQEAFGDMFPVWIETVAETAAKLREMLSAAQQQEAEAERIAAEREAEARRQKEEADRLAAERAALEAERQQMFEEARKAREAEEARMAQQRAELEAQRQELERAVAARQEQERQEEAARQAEIERQEAAARRAEEERQAQEKAAAEFALQPEPEPVAAVEPPADAPVVALIVNPTDADITRAVQDAFGMSLMAAAERLGFYDAAAEIARIRSTQ